MAKNWARANDWVLAKKTVPVNGNAFHLSLEAPEKAVPGGTCFLKVYVTGKKGASMGVAKIRIGAETKEEGGEEEEDGF